MMAKKEGMLPLPVGISEALPLSKIILIVQSMWFEAL